MKNENTASQPKVASIGDDVAFQALAGNFKNQKGDSFKHLVAYIDSRTAQHQPPAVQAESVASPAELGALLDRHARAWSISNANDWDSTQERINSRAAIINAAQSADKPSVSALRIANDVRWACMKLYSPDDSATDWADKMAALELKPIIDAAIRALAVSASADGSGE